MFRRSQDDTTMNDAEANGAQGSLLGSGMSEGATPIPASTGYNAPASAAPVYGAPQRPVEAARPQPAPMTPVGGFRPAPQPEQQRARMPEAKPLSPYGSAPAAAGAPAVRESRRVLTVGSDILLKGEIATCDRLVIEGKVDAVLNDVGTVELAESGSFKGVATVENAEISGLFEGELVVKGRLVIYASGRVRGKVTYGEIEIERGGELTGEIKTMAAATQSRAAARPEKSLAKEEKPVAA